MASISPTTFPSSSTCSDANSNKFTFHNNRLKRVNIPLSRSPPSSLCRCHVSTNNSEAPSPPERWDAALQEVVRSAIKRLGDYISSRGRGVEESEERENEAVVVEEEEWDWVMWRRHFSEVDEQERILSVLESQLTDAVKREDYGDACRMKVAIAAAAANDTVGQVMSHLNRAIEEERYQDAALVRDFAGAGLLGWWSGISEDTDQDGVIIHINAEYGRYVARSYSPRQLATATAGPPLFEVFLTINKRGEYKQQAVYLRRTKAPQEFPALSFKSPISPKSLNPLDSTDEIDLLSGTEEAGDGEDDESDSDSAEGLSGSENIMRDTIPGLKVKVLKVTALEKVDHDLLSKVVEQELAEDEEEKNSELEVADKDSEDFDDSDKEQNGIEMDAGGIFDGEDRSEVAVKVVVVGDLAQSFSDGLSHEDVTRVPARLEKTGRSSFSISIENDDNSQVTDGKGTGQNKKERRLGQHSMDAIIHDLVKSVGKGKIPKKNKIFKQVIRDAIKFYLNRTRNRQELSGCTRFSRLEIPSSPDPLNGLYIGTHGLYTSEVIHLRRKFGQWKADAETKKQPNLEFYEYVEAVKLTGDPYVPAGQVAFRAKVGKKYQLPHKGLIPEEFGVIARYKGQGRLAEPGFRNPRWVDGELFVLDGKYIKGGPVVGFVYWNPEHHLLVFFNHLRLQG